MVSESPRKELRVLVVDDSAVVRLSVSTILSREPDITVQTAPDPLVAEQRMASFAPDVMILDIEMPRMDGLTFLGKLMTSRPLPVVVCSSYAENGSEMALRALELGAVELIPKPRLGVRDFLQDSAVALVDAVRGAAMARVRGRPASAPVRRPSTEEARAREAPQRSASAGTPSSIGALRQTADAVLSPMAAPTLTEETLPIIAIGASTGGTEALRFLLDALPGDMPPILIVQHMPVAFTAAFAGRLAKTARMVVREATNGEVVARGKALIARGDRHLVLRRQGERCHVDLVDGPLVSRHRPSVDVLFRSVAQAVGARAVGLIMTGMGDDGAQGLLEMKEAGANTFAQDEATSVVFGMPREAILRGATSSVLPLGELPAALVRAAGALTAALDGSQRRRSP